MGKSYTEVVKQIAAIDRQIDRNRATANDKAVEHDLFRQRGFLQLERDEALEASQLRHAMRPLRTKTCPTCGHRSYAAA